MGLFFAKKDPHTGNLLVISGPSDLVFLNMREEGSMDPSLRSPNKKQTHIIMLSTVKKCIALDSFCCSSPRLDLVHYLHHHYHFYY